MRIVVKKVGQPPEVKEVNCELYELKEIVGGWIESFRLGFNNILCVCNEEGKLFKLPVNFICHGDPICGDVFFCSKGYDDFESLNDEQIETIMTLMQVFEK